MSPVHMHVVTVPTERPIYSVLTPTGERKEAHVLERTEERWFVHFLGDDKRNDCWVSAAECTLIGTTSTATTMTNSEQSRKRKRGEWASSPTGREPLLEPIDGFQEAEGSGAQSTAGVAPSSDFAEHVEEVMMTEEEYDLEQHKKMTARRNFDDVYFGHWKIKTWYYSPYPLDDHELDETPANNSISNSYNKITVARPTGGRSRGRASELFARALKNDPTAEVPNLWVCDRCLKYFAEGLSWEVHKKICIIEHPPGRLVYKRGAHAIREIDGSVEKLYCQNLSLFGKLFIDVKTLFFDTDNFMFYILTDEDPTREHMVGFFSKEKHSFDDYNLACIMTLPQYQRKGFGMLMIEFSYELSRRAKKFGTPERPLSDLGLRSYLAYWVATVIRLFRRVLSVLPPAAESLIVKNRGNFPDLEVPTPGEVIDPAYELGKRKKAKTLPPVDAQVTPFDELSNEIFTKFRVFETTLNPDGSAQTHIVVLCTIGDIARAINLRLDDTAFALNESGLLTKRLDDHDGRQRVVITREHVEQVAEERKVKKMCMDLRYVCIDSPPRGY